MIKYEVHVDYDEWNENPTDYSDWEVISFNRNHVNYQHPDSLDKDLIEEELKNDRAFMLDYFEHSQCQWYLSGEGYYCPWDTSTCAGIIRLKDGVKSFKEAEDAARSFLEAYTSWCNGEIYFYSVNKIEYCPHCEQEIEELLDSCGGFYGNDFKYMIDCIKEAANNADEDEIKFTGINISEWW